MNNTDTALNSTTVTLSIRNDVIFKKVFSKKKIIQPFLEDVTKQKLDDIEIVDAEKTVYPSARARYNRFDVCLLNSGDGMIGPFITAIVSGLAGWLLATVRDLVKKGRDKAQENNAVYKALIDGVIALLRSALYGYYRTYEH
ncbi:MAG: hypothetical protein VZT48_08440 [Bulleidia sp.]|nr:hypothetical protein [Bulleidia sp.]